MPVGDVAETVSHLLIFTLVVIAVLHLTGTIRSTTLFAGVLYIAVAVVAFQAGTQYSELKRS